MSFIQTISHLVPEPTQRAGQVLYLKAVFTYENVHKKELEVEFQRPEEVNTSIRLSDRKLLVYCDCDAFGGNLRTCRHLWASYLLVEDLGVLEVPTGTAELSIEPDHMLLEDEEMWTAGDEEMYEDKDEDDFEPDHIQPKDVLQMMARRALGEVTPPPKPKPIDWKDYFGEVRSVQQQPQRSYSDWTPTRQFIYLLDIEETVKTSGLVVKVGYRERKRDGDWGKPRFQRLAQTVLDRCQDPLDREILTTLVGARQQNDGYYGYRYYTPSDVAFQYTLRPPVTPILRLMCSTQRCFYQGKSEPEPVGPLGWDEPAWELWLNVEEVGTNYHLSGQLRRGEERAVLADARLFTSQGVIIWPECLSEFDLGPTAPWLALLGKQQLISIPKHEGSQLVEQLLAMPQMPRIELPTDLHFEQVEGTPSPRLVVKAAEGQQRRDRVHGHLSFEYAGHGIEYHAQSGGAFDTDNKRFVRRDKNQELMYYARLLELGFKEGYGYSTGPGPLEMIPRNLSRAISTLLEEGWHVEAEGKVYRSGGMFDIQVQSGIDWFELHGKADFDGQQAPLPKLLEAIRKGENTVELGDGTFGMLPEAWMKKYGLLAGLGTKEDDHVRFSPSQAGLLDALLASQPEVKLDEKFMRVRDELNSFSGVEPREPSAGFQGELRPYQKEGVGWLYFLRKFGLGGCLADDMGLGKTVQVLALLEAQRQASADEKQASKASLLVVPRSLVFNWIEEAKRFAPKLRVLDQTGNKRDKNTKRFDEYDVVLITYGTLRRDILKLKGYPFEYCILDEAQAIKNSTSQAAKAARVVQANHRLALSGTPVENHLGELWSIFEFLNPGMLGGARIFKKMTGKKSDQESRQVLAKALRPFLLRRTKEEVVTDLPSKTEQTIYCELEGAQRKEYDELREYYRRSLLTKVQSEGMNKAKIQVLEALLRLRQAACHPGLISKEKQGDSSAKLDVLLPQLTELTAEGHKVLVFSQFTQLLGIVRKHLDDAKLEYAYLDGQTRNRQEKVDEFQNDPECKLFLISLKAGGLGLNLTAADYVILLDPWWNPAVESQAIDRAHRIGQTKPVFAYRIIARNTVEEKVLKLQQSKRELADAIINADNGLIGNLSSEDLELLLS